MSSNTKQGILTSLFLVLLVGIGYGLFLAGRTLFGVITNVDSSIAVAIIAAAGTGLVSVLSIVLGKAYEARAKIENENRAKRIPVYEDLIRFSFRAFMGQKSGNPLNEREMLEFMMDFSQRIVVWGSDDVISAWAAFRGGSMTSKLPAGVETLFLYEKLIFAIRRDLGYRNRNLSKGDILSLWVTDIRDHLQK